MSTSGGGGGAADTTYIDSNILEKLEASLQPSTHSPPPSHLGAGEAGWKRPSPCSAALPCARSLGPLCMKAGCIVPFSSRTTAVQQEALPGVRVCASGLLRRVRALCLCPRCFVRAPV